MTYRKMILGLLMTVAIGFAGWTTLSYRPSYSSVVTVSALPDGYMEDVVATIMNKQGKVKMKIVTPKMVHYAEGDTTHLTTPYLTLYRQSPQPWYIESKYAKATQGIENVNFWDNVSVHHPADNNNPATVIKTNSLLVHPNAQTAETQEYITLIQPNTIINATGMFADINTGDIKLLSKARGEYVPNS